MAHLTPNAIMTLAIFAHLCEMFVRVRLSLRLFRWFFTVQPVSPPTVVGGCYFQPRGQASNWRVAVDLGDGYDAVLDRLAGLRSQGLTGAMVFGDYLRRRIAPLQRRARGAWEYTGPEDIMRTHQGRKWDWDPEDFRMVVQRVLNLSSVEASLIPQGVLPLCCDPERADVLTIMQERDPVAPPRHSKSGRSEAEETATAEARRREADRREAADRLREAEEAAQEAVRVRQAEEAAREEARLRRAGESVREAEAARARQAACQTSDPTPPEGTTTSEATHDEAAGARLGPDPSGDTWDEPASRDAPESGTSIGGPSRASPTPRRLSPLSSAAPLSAEPFLQALAAANSTVLDGLSAQMEALQAERAELDVAWARVEEGRRSVEAMVEAGRKAHLRHTSQLEAHHRDLAEIAREVEEERETALIATAVLDEARDDLRLQYGSRAAELEEKLDAARGVLDAAAARERRAAENEAASRQCEEALEARATALEERARALDTKERDLADREAAVATREATLVAHEAACAEEESALRLREDALTERERALEEAEAAAQRLADSLFLREAAREEQARRNLEGARAERAALDQRAAELEARAKELDARAHSGGAAAGHGDLAACLAAAEHTIAELQGALDSSAGEVEALRLASETAPGGRRVSGAGGTRSTPPTRGGLAQRLSEMAGALQRLPEELEETIKSSSRDLARGAVELVLASYQARDPDFSPWAALEEFPPGTEDGARARVRDAADYIVHSFEGTAPRLAFALDSDEEGGDDGADDSGDEADGPGAPE
uniref:OSJNBb0014D23.3 protein n=1 Tax=Oryza sativa subsp. japonica TaxID=39947 RepID=Q7XL86_ORYSJ|nr:OSJNBb0014D23.3 [Oryza sativa Japonica Group]